MCLLSVSLNQNIGFLRAGVLSVLFILLPMPVTVTSTQEKRNRCWLNKYTDPLFLYPLPWSRTIRAVLLKFSFRCSIAAVLERHILYQQDAHWDYTAEIHHGFSKSPCELSQFTHVPADQAGNRLNHPLEHRPPSWPHLRSVVTQNLLFTTSYLTLLFQIFCRSNPTMVSNCPSMLHLSWGMYNVIQSSTTEATGSACRKNHIWMDVWEIWVPKGAPGTVGMDGTRGCSLNRVTLTETRNA